MKKFTFIVLLLIAAGLSASAGVQHLLPRPQISSFQSGASFRLDRDIHLTLPEIGENDPAVGAELSNLIVHNGGSVSDGALASVSVTLTDAVKGAEFQDEAYSLTITADAIDIKAVTLRGAYWAVQTLWQLSEDNANAVACGEVTDWAAFKIRGYTHDVGRGFLEFAELKNHIDKLSRFKINTFHWHLTENQGWRLESKVYPQLVADASFSRLPGKYYTIEQAKELVKYASQHGITVIPEIDMPGHSLAFRKAMGHSMLTPSGLTEMKAIMTEACETFSGTPWMHIGTDELRSEDAGTMNWTSFVPQMVAHIRGLGKKVVSWNPGYTYSSDDIDMIHMWSSSGRPVTGVPAIDSRYHYANHFDNYADIVSLYKSTISDQKKGSDQYAGVIVSFWNDRYLPSDEAIVKQNSFYSSLLAIAERSWFGGGEGYFPVVGTTLRSTDSDFIDWEGRFLFHKANYLKDEPIVYVKQTNVRWRITDQFPNNGTLTATFPPETSGLSDSYTYNGKTYGTSDALGAGIYLRHVWGTTVPGFYSNPQANHTAYAYTYVYSPSAQQVGLTVEFQNYSRSESDLAPQQGKWDYKGSRIWINDNEIAPPVWENTHTTKSTEITLKNENLAAREPIAVNLKQGWNKVLMKLPVGSFSGNETRLVKWMFNCVFTTPDGRDAVEGLVYSPDKNLNSDADVLIDAISSANAAKSGVEQGDNPGQYSSSVISELDAEIAKAQVLKDTDGLGADEYRAAAEVLMAKVEEFKAKYNRPKASVAGNEYWYKLVAPERDNKVVAYRGNNTALYGETFLSGSEKQQWKFVKLSDDTYCIVNRQAESHISPNSAFNTALKAQAGVQSSGGWTFNFIGSGSLFTVTCGDVQLNQTTSDHYLQVYNWGSGTNTSDAGCRYKIELVDQVSTNPLHGAITLANNLKNSVSVGDDPGQYPQSAINVFAGAIEAAGSVADDENATEQQIQDALDALEIAEQTFKESYNKPVASDGKDNYWYSISSVRDGEKAITAASSYIYGEAYNGSDQQQWKFVELPDNSFALVNRANGKYILTEATLASGGNSSVKVFGWGNTTLPSGKGWKYEYLHDGVMFGLYSDFPSQMHMLNSGSAYKIGNYGIDGSTGEINRTDVGCKFQIVLREHEKNSGIDDLKADDQLSAVVDVVGRVVTVTGFTGKTIRILDVTGRVLASYSGSDSITFELPHSGIYLVALDAGVRKIAVR